MATLKMTSSTTVGELKKQFKDSFGSSLRVYKGGRIADDALVLSEIGLKTDGVLECRSSLTVAGFINRMMNDHGLKVKVYTCDEWVACLDGLTLGFTGKVKKNAVKADMECMIAYKRNEDVLEDEEDEEEEEWEDPLDTITINNIVFDIYSNSATCRGWDDFSDAATLSIPDSVSYEGQKYAVTSYEPGIEEVAVVKLPASIKFVDESIFDIEGLEKIIVHSPKGQIICLYDDGSDSDEMAEKTLEEINDNSVEICYV